MNNLALIWAYWAYLALSWADMVFKSFKVSNFPSKSLFSFHSVPGRQVLNCTLCAREDRGMSENRVKRKHISPI